MFNFFRKKSDDSKLKETIEEMQKSLKSSFGNIKKDFSTIDKHHKGFHEKHEKHEGNHEKHEDRLQQLHERLLVLESLMNNSQKEKIPIEIAPEEELEFDELEEMTEVSQKICYILAALAQENKELVTLKNLAEEMYPGKDYTRIRSTISQYTTELEELGYVQKKKKGRHVYIKSTEKNPFLKEKIILKKKIKTKNKS
jgi:hypothetical protein